MSLVIGSREVSVGRPTLGLDVASAPAYVRDPPVQDKQQGVVVVASSCLSGFLKDGESALPACVGDLAAQDKQRAGVSGLSGFLEDGDSGPPAQGRELAAQHQQQGVALSCSSGLSKADDSVKLARVSDLAQDKGGLVSGFSGFLKDDAAADDDDHGDDDHGRLKREISKVGQGVSGKQDDASSESSSIGVPEDSDDDVLGDGDGEEVQSNFTRCLASLEESLPIKRGLSNHYAGKSKSFANLLEVNNTLKLKDMAKSENPLNKRRRLLIAHKWRRSSFYSSLSPTSMPLLALNEDEHEDDDPSEEQAQAQNLHERTLKVSFKPAGFSLADLQHA